MEYNQWMSLGGGHWSHLVTFWAGEELPSKYMERNANTEEQAVFSQH